MLEGHVASSRAAPEHHYALLFAFCFAESKIPLLFWWSVATSAGWWNRLNCHEIYNTRSFWLPCIAFSFRCVCLTTKSPNAFDYALIFLCFGVHIRVLALHDARRNAFFSWRKKAWVCSAVLGGNRVRQNRPDGRTAAGRHGNDGRRRDGYA
jgi:hypothetical protein